MEHAGAYDANSIKVLLVLCNFQNLSEFWPTKRQKAFHLDAIGVPGQYWGNMIHNLGCIVGSLSPLAGTCNHLGIQI